MKQKKYIILIIILLLLASCGGNRMVDKKIAYADSLMDANQDSARAALAMLDSLKARNPKMSKGQRMHYELVYAKGMNKGFVDFKTDSVMKQVVDYYDDHGSANDRMLANYLLGCVYRDLKDSPACLDWYHKATECADTASVDCDYELLAIIYGQMGYLQYAQDMPKFALEALEKTKKYATISKDTVLYLQALSNQGLAYYKQGNKHKYLENKKYLFQRYTQLGMKQDAALELCSTIYEHISSSNLAKAKYLIDTYERVSGLMDENGKVAKGKEIYHGTKGDYYLKSNQVDSAIIMYRKLLQTTSLIDEKEKAYTGLMQVFQMKGKLDSVAKYAILAKNATDSVYHEMATNTLIKMQSLYNYDQMERKAKALEFTTQKMKHKYEIILGIVLFGGILIIVHFKQKSIKHKMELKLRTEQLQVKLLQYRQDNQELAETQQDLQVLLSQGKQSEENLKQEYEQRIAQLKERIMIFESPSTLEEYSRVNDTLDKSYIRSLLDKKAIKGEEMTEDELSKVKNLLAEQTPKFYALVQHTEMLSEKQIAICFLVRLGFSSSDIQHLLKISSGYATNAKKTISKKLFGTEMLAKDFEERIHKML